MTNPFPPSQYKRIDALFRAGEFLWRRRHGVSKAFPCANAPDYWYWLMWYGPKLFPLIQQNGYAFPPAAFIQRVIGEPATAKRFNESGLVDWRRIEGCLRSAGFDFQRGGNVLDFGCGCGRILRHFALYADACSFYGGDVDADLVAWCKLHFDFAQCATMPLMPPTPYASNQFDAVYAYSVFSHLPLEAAQAWRDELHRICKPGAVVVLTLQGNNVVRSITTRVRDLGTPSAQQLERDAGKFQQEGFLFYPYPAQSESETSWMNACQYGNTFFSEAFARTFWSAGFDGVEYLPAPDDWQDYIILRRV
ncbi:MAG: class I SAM-dependent methyltransferase [Candidatus Hinthialibacter antarcticus]|nr:class I SAM-dependent methyltransferase [Candidatus Hinthialibacter antarcticus]